MTASKKIRFQFAFFLMLAIGSPFGLPGVSQASERLGSLQPFAEGWYYSHGVDAWFKVIEFEGTGVYLYRPFDQVWIWMPSIQSEWGYRFNSELWLPISSDDSVGAAYLQSFSNDTGSMQQAAEFGWRWFYSSGAIEGTYVSNRIHYFSGSTVKANVGHAPVPYGDGLSQGAWIGNSTEIQVAFVEIYLTIAEAEGATLAVDMNMSNTLTPVRFVIRIGGDWFVSNQVFYDGPETWTHCEISVSKNSGGWVPLVLRPGEVLSKPQEEPLVWDDIRGEITAVGFYVEPEGVHRLDNFEIRLPKSLREHQAARTAPGDKESFDLYLLIGQSNMVGRGVEIEPVDQNVQPEIWSLGAEDQWLPAKEPLHYWSSLGGVGPGFSFARWMAEQKPNRMIGLIPSAVGGTVISYWHPSHSSGNYNEAIRRARVAMEDGRLRGVVWQQGESDSTDVYNRAELYESRLFELINNLRRDLGDPQLPIVLGGLPPILHEREDRREFAQLVETALLKAAKELDNVEYVPGSKSGHIGDELHYNSKAQRENGINYAEAMFGME